MRLATRTTSPALADPFRSLRDLYTPRQVAGLLHRERARADRHGREFALVVLQLRHTDGEWAILRMARLLLDAARGTDEVGRYDDDAVCAILPDTDAGGAWYFARRACEQARQKGLDPICMVYSYPSDWAPGEEPGAEPRFKHARRRRSEQDHNRNDADGTPRLTYHAAGNGSDDTPVGQLQELFTAQTPFWKRAIDFLGALIGVIALSPLLLLIGVLIKVTDPSGPVIFKQRRAGMAGRPFTIYKFRTMHTDAEQMKQELLSLNEQSGPAFKITHDPRITPLGKFLRKTSLDELPQLFNVLKGDMSLVGPRPLPIEESQACDQWQKRRLDVAPGLTCIWQVHGRGRVSFDEWARMDIRYIRRRKLWHDIFILLQTIPAVLLRRGAK